MGLDVGLTVFTEKEYEEELRTRGTEEYYNGEPHGENLINCHGWGNPECKWITDEIEDFDFNNYWSQPLSQADLHRMIAAAADWHLTNLSFAHAYIVNGVRRGEGSNLGVFPVDGVEIKCYDTSSEGFIYRMMNDESEDRLFITKSGYNLPFWEDYNKAVEFIQKMTDILLKVDWDSDIVLAYYSC